jgi:hypothetical protein
MEGLRLLTGTTDAVPVPCCRCQATGCPWDQINGKAICPDCQEALALGEGPPLVERLEPRPCAVCRQAGSIRYLTVPLHTQRPLEIDLCPDHFRALLKRRLDARSLAQLAHKLEGLGVTRRQVFLLHESFYDESGRALQPVPDLH